MIGVRENLEKCIFTGRELDVLDALQRLGKEDVCVLIGGAFSVHQGEGAAMHQRPQDHHQGATGRQDSQAVQRRDGDEGDDRQQHGGKLIGRQQEASNKFTAPDRDMVEKQVTKQEWIALREPQVGCCKESTQEIATETLLAGARETVRGDLGDERYGHARDHESCRKDCKLDYE